MEHLEVPQFLGLLRLHHCHLRQAADASALAASHKQASNLTCVRLRDRLVVRNSVLHDRLMQIQEWRPSAWTTATCYANGSSMASC